MGQLCQQCMTRAQKRGSARTRVSPSVVESGRRIAGARVAAGVSGSAPAEPRPLLPGEVTPVFGHPTASIICLWNYCNTRGGSRLDKTKVNPCGNLPLDGYLRLIHLRFGCFKETGTNLIHLATGSQSCCRRLSDQQSHHACCSTPKLGPLRETL